MNSNNGQEAVNPEGYKYANSSGVFINNAFANHRLNQIISALVRIENDNDFEAMLDAYLANIGQDELDAINSQEISLEEAQRIILRLQNEAKTQHQGNDPEAVLLKAIFGDQPKNVHVIQLGLKDPKIGMNRFQRARAELNIENPTNLGVTIAMFLSGVASFGTGYYLTTKESRKKRVLGHLLKFVGAGAMIGAPIYRELYR